MTRVGVIGGHCQLLEALRESLRRQKARPVYQAGILTAREVMRRRGADMSAIFVGSKSGGRR